MNDNDKKKDVKTADRAKRLTKEQLEAIRGGISTSLPNPTIRPVFYTKPVKI